jgi:protein-S-isoprenylcysteine O-methyltransferase Ste14
MTPASFKLKSQLSERTGAVARRVFVRLTFLGAGAAAVLFLTAGTVDFLEAKAWLVATLAPAALLALQFVLQDPEVLIHRLDPRRKTRRERLLVGWFSPIFVIAFFVPGLDLRFKWSDAEVETVPLWLALAADGLIVCAILFAAYVMKFMADGERKSRNTELLTSGPYHLIRHPLFAASLVVWLATPIALGSWVALPAFLLASSYYVLELRQQERLLLQKFSGYAAYCRRTPFRLIPFVW